MRGVIMNTAKNQLLKLIEDIPESQIPEIIDFIGFLKNKKEDQVYRDLERTSESSIDFWDNDKDSRLVFSSGWQSQDEN